MNAGIGRKGNLARSCRYLICFAVREEAQPFQQLLRQQPEISVLITGIGPRNADRAIRSALALERPDAVLSCGFAGALNPELNHGTIVFSTDGDHVLARALDSVNARPVRFHSTKSIIATAAEKRRLRETTGADAVEMESASIAAVCREQQIPVAIVRVISDGADEDLPLDFNGLMDLDQKLDYRKLGWALFKSPGKIGGLLTLQRQAKLAAGELAETLARVISSRAQIRP